MRLLVVADAARRTELEESLAADFELAWAADVPQALSAASDAAVDAVLVHLDLGETALLDLICEFKRGAPDRTPGVVALAREIDHRALVEIVRTGAYDVLLEGALQPRELVHALRNAAYYAQSAASLIRRREARSKEVLVVGEGDAASSIVLLLEAAGFTVRLANRLPHVGAKVSPRAIVVDLATVHDGEALVRLLAAG